MANSHIKLRVVGNKPIASNIMRMFAKANGDYTLHRDSADKGTIYEYSLHKSDLSTKGGSLSVFPCFDKKYVKHLKKGGTLLVDDDVLVI